MFPRSDWSTLGHIVQPVVMNLRWPFLHLAALRDTQKKVATELDTECSGSVHWLCAVRSGRGNSSASLCQTEVQKCLVWLSSLFDQAVSGILTDLLSSQMRPSLQKPFSVSPPFQQSLLFSDMIFGALQGFMSFLGCIQPVAHYIRMWNLLFFCRYSSGTSAQFGPCHLSPVCFSDLGPSAKFIETHPDKSATATDSFVMGSKRSASRELHIIVGHPSNFQKVWWERKLELWYLRHDVSFPSVLEVTAATSEQIIH